MLWRSGALALWHLEAFNARPVHALTLGHSGASSSVALHLGAQFFVCFIIFGASDPWSHRSPAMFLPGAASLLPLALSHSDIQSLQRSAALALALDQLGRFGPLHSPALIHWHSHTCTEFTHPCMHRVIDLLIHSFIHPLHHSLIHSLGPSFMSHSHHLIDALFE